MIKKTNLIIVSKALCIYSLIIFCIGFMIGQKICLI